MNILIVEDHPFTAEGYADALLKSTTNPIIAKAHDCETAYMCITNAFNDKKTYDLILLDQSLPGYAEQSLFSGIDLGILIKKKMPHCKLIMITAHTEILIIYDIVKKLSPEGLIIKNDITQESLRTTITEVLEGNFHQSPMVKSCINEIWKKDLMVDDYNRLILTYLHQGFKVKDLEAVVPLTISAIHRRIAQMKDVFDVNENSTLVKEAILQGYI